MKDIVINQAGCSVKSKDRYNFTLSQNIYLVFKRFCDVFLAVFFIVLLSPIMLVIAFLIRFSTKGSVIFSQKRIGQFGKIIKVYKFRTMLLCTPESVATGELDNPNFYITKIGRILRLTSLDEIPQLFNVFKGDMSIIGPRPIIPEEEELHRLRGERKVYSIKPGITGLAQVSGRDLLTVEKKVKFDELYLKNVSLRLDLYVLVKSVVVVFKRADFFEGRVKKDSTNA